MWGIDWTGLRHRHVKKRQHVITTKKRGRCKTTVKYIIHLVLLLTLTSGVWFTRPILIVVSTVIQVSEVPRVCVERTQQNSHININNSNHNHMAMNRVLCQGHRSMWHFDFDNLSCNQFSHVGPIVARYTNQRTCAYVWWRGWYRTIQPRIVIKVVVHVYIWMTLMQATDHQTPCHHFNDWIFH